jgi:hypothetical protein
MRLEDERRIALEAERAQLALDKVKEDEVIP